MINFKTRVSKHKDYLVSRLIELDTDRRKLCESLTLNNKDEVVNKIIFKRELQKRYLRRLKLVKL